MSSENPSRTYTEEEREFLKMRLAQMHEGIIEGVRKEVAWLRKHNFPVWVSRDGKIVDASADAPPED